MESARYVTTSLAPTAVTVRRATSMTRSAKYAPVCNAVTGLPMVMSRLKVWPYRSGFKVVVEVL